MAQLKEQNKTPEKELNKSEMAKLSDAEFKTLVIRMLKELTEYGNNIKEEMKVTVSEIKTNLQGTNNEEKEAKIQNTLLHIWLKSNNGNNNNDSQLVQIINLY